MHYSAGHFDRDLSHVCEPCGGERICICSFLPDYPLVPFIAEPARRIKRLEARYEFVSTLLWNVLLDQAAYSAEHRDLASRRIGLGSPKLVGVLATFNANVHPAHLLIALSFDPPEEQVKVDFALSAIGREWLPGAASKLGSSWPSILARMESAFAPGATPDTIRAYVPNGDEYYRQPNWQVVDAWNAVVRQTLGECASALANEG